MTETTEQTVARLLSATRIPRAWRYFDRPMCCAWIAVQLLGRERTADEEQALPLLVDICAARVQAAVDARADEIRGLE
jgi:hypothetical protein